MIKKKILFVIAVWFMYLQFFSPIIDQCIQTNKIKIQKKNNNDDDGSIIMWIKIKK